MTLPSELQTDAESTRTGRRLSARPATRRADAYPWGRWENGEWWLIKRGEQFRCTPAGMRSTLRSRAAREGHVVDVVLGPDDAQIPVGKEHQYLAFRFRGPEQTPGP
jgi:hypothetical protein